MKYLSVLFVSVLALISISADAQSNTIGKIEAEIALPVTATEANILNFGKVSAELQGGTVQISPTGERTTSGSIVLMDQTYSAGKFVLTGMPNGLVSIKLPQTVQTLTLLNGNTTITVDKFVSDIPSGGVIIRQADGKAEVNIGATLSIPSGLSNLTGAYTGTYEAVFMYN